jgi:dextranase
MIRNIWLTGLLGVATVFGMAGCEANGVRTEDIRITQESSREWLRALHTDKARYAPGEPVRFSLSFRQQPADGELHVRYKHLNEVIAAQKITQLASDGAMISWEWEPPEADYTGYMAEVFYERGGVIVDQQNIGVDVSSDWSRFPRYGYLAEYPEMSAEEQQAIVDRLNRFHLNGIQFYDWKNKHHRPVKLVDGKLAESWPDIANRQVSRDTVLRYIELLHERGIKAMHYNLIFGSYEDAELDGVRREWGLFMDMEGGVQDKHPLPSSWASDIMLNNPANQEWQEYIIGQHRDVFTYLPFDGWHMDQLGDRGVRWDFEGNRVHLDQTYRPFIERAKEELGVSIVLNAVDQYGQPHIAQAPVDFLYTEVWSMKHYRNLKDIIETNWNYSGYRLNSVLAAYMNYALADGRGEFNTPGVLLTDAVIFASGGAHIELGESMLGKEYFPNRNLTVPDLLYERLVHYYDFLVAYQNLLRDGVKPAGLDVASDDIAVSDRAERGAVWAFAREKEDRLIVHLINFTDAVHMDWQDSHGMQTEPAVRTDLRIRLETSREVSRVWMASPDRLQGSAQPLDFRQNDGNLEFTLPSLKYWDMVVVEYSG